MENSKEVAVRVNQKPVVLGGHDAIVKMTETGLVKAVKANVKLSEKTGEIACVQGKTLITAPGYYKLNQVVGVNFYMPDKLTLPDDSIVVNPYPIIDPESSTLRKVWIRETGVGYNALGNLQVVTITLLYDINVYFADTLMKKIERNKQAGKLCMEASLTEEEKKTGIFVRLDGLMGLWANMSCPDTFDAVKQFLQDKKFGERKAQSVIERNIIKKITGITYVDASGPEKGRVASVPVIGWTHDLTREDIEKIVTASQKGEKPAEFKGYKIDYDESAGEVTPDEVILAADEEEDKHPEDTTQHQEEINTEEAAGDADQKVDELKALRDELVQAKEIIGEAAYNKIIGKFKKPVEQFTAEEIEKAKKLLNTAVDNQEKGDRF